MITVNTTLDARGGILVGDDGSRASRQAVTWTAKVAEKLGLPLHVVRVWVISSAPRPRSATGGYVPPLTDFEAAVQERLDADVAGLGLPAGCEVRTHVLHGPAGRRLVEASEHAKLLVVGTRGAGGFLGLHIGSTADQVVRHARCPVTVVPVDTADDEDTDLDVQLLEQPEG